VLDVLWVIILSPSYMRWFRSSPKKTVKPNGPNAWQKKLMLEGELAVATRNWNNAVKHNRGNKDLLRNKMWNIRRALNAHKKQYSYLLGIKF
jgi:hypothetical protein